MKKYVRTKDGIYELKVNEELKAQKTSNYFYIQHKGYGCNLLYDKQDLKKFKQADTIEELCDGYLCFTKSNKNWVVTENYETAKLYAERGCKVYACILTDKGLIYVAKMNDKGVLELL